VSRARKPSLVELVITLAILGVLAAAVVPGLRQARERASAPSAEPPAAAPDGQFNTIDAPGEPGALGEGAAEDIMRPLRKAVAMFVAVALALAILAAARREARRAQR
jgi:hypothetical protein